MRHHGLCAFAAALAFTSGAHAFSMYEHKEIGDKGFALALAIVEKASKGAAEKLLKLPNLLASKGGLQGEHTIAALANGKPVAWFSFGDLVGTYGDQAEGYEEVNSAGIATRVPNLKKMLVEGSSHANDFERSRMIDLGAVNVTHFAGTALDTYVKWHKKALSLAADPKRLSEALHYEALALHSYTDLFALGHMIEERGKTNALVAWVKRQSWLLKPLKKLIGKALGVLWGLVANFYHNAFNHTGGDVTNRDGDVWRAYGDNKYRIVAATCTEPTYLGQRKCEDPTTRAQRRVVEAGVSRSISTVLKVAARQELAKGEALSALRKLAVSYKNTRLPVPMSSQKWKVLKLIVKLGKAFAKKGFDFTAGVLGYEKKPGAGNVPYVAALDRYLSEP